MGGMRGWIPPSRIPSRADYTAAERPEFVRDMVSRLPQRNYTVLRHIVRFLAEVAAKSAENKCHSA